ncbi:hypothetical protein OIU34_09835 [Pararhizobium sp. BT-229]|uniref:hypothetical protein n=1 Tax=Pararhizobium sp. BT-229 TaxID=2986923 RepID=UPI0021F7B56B|nr:hypothetical protein [Pararhizobium sp. BT-229]MCV9962198.1 hypothetical protein [Pararhizobium sp. BT-229]
MPILTVKPATIAAQAAIVEATTPKERPVAVPLRISGSQSEAVLKILETLNRHLVGSEPLPKEALIRLLDTLAKILKFPPLPQETLRDFTKRLAVFLETLPPAARLALEKQLGQRNLAVSIRILMEALKGPTIIDPSRLPDKFPTATARPVIGQPDGKPAVALPVSHGQSAIPGRSAPLPAVQAALIAATTIADPRLLQAVLKEAFGGEEEISHPVAVAEESTGEPTLATTVRREEQPTRTQTPPGKEMATASTQRQQSARSNAESIPLLRAAAAFLAADPEALLQVAAIAQGDIDSQTRTDLEKELGLDLSEQTGPVEMAEQPLHTEQQPPAEQTSGKTEPEPALEKARGEDAKPVQDDAVSPKAAATPQTAAEPATIPEQDVQTETAQPSSTAPLQKPTEVEGFQGRDLGEWELQAEPEGLSTVSAHGDQPAAVEPETPHDENTLVQTLKALIEASLPLPEGSVATTPQTPLAALAGDAADMAAQALFAQLEAADEAVALPDTTLLTGDISAQTEQVALEGDNWSALLDVPEDGSANRPALTHPSTTDEVARESQVPRQQEAGIVRDAIPFAMIPYLPAKIDDVRKVKAEDEEEAAFADGEEQDERGETGGQPDEHHAAEPDVETEADGTETADAYDLYKRMGGLG